MAVTSIVKGYYEEIGFSQEMNEMNNQRLHGQMNDKNFFTSAIVQSQNLVNAAHYDVDDKTMSIATWTELDIGKAINWYFILPNVTRDGHKGIAINIWLIISGGDNKAPNINMNIKAKGRCFIIVFKDIIFVLKNKNNITVDLPQFNKSK